MEQKLELLAQSKLKSLAQTNLKVLEDRIGNVEKSLTEEIIIAEKNSKFLITQIGSASPNCVKCKRRLNK